jgi:hypothetical protein
LYETRFLMFTVMFLPFARFRPSDRLNAGPNESMTKV